jgi:hypothetical protein
MLEFPSVAQLRQSVQYVTVTKRVAQTVVSLPEGVRN